MPNIFLSNFPSICKAVCLALTFVCLTLTAQTVQSAKQKKLKYYDFEIHADFSGVGSLASDDACVPVTVTVKQDRAILRELEWHDSSIFSQFSADGELKKRKKAWRWKVPKKGGVLEYCTVLTHKRGDSYDSRVTKDWALFRADDLLPAAASKAVRSGRARTRLIFSLPDNWSSATRYPLVDKHTYSVRNPERNFDRPTGWVQLGEFGVRRDIVDGTKVAIAAPFGQEVRRLEILTLLAFTLPEIKDWFELFPERLLVVSASDQMWRGALSGPGSLYIHGDRALVSENGTSTIVHELVHIGMQRQAVENADWIDEGIAEYMAILLLHRAGGLTENRFNIALDEQRQWAKQAKSLGKRNSTGAETAKAVVLFANLHEEMGDKNFKEWVKRVAQRGEPITLAELRRLALEVHGTAVNSLPSG